MLSAIDDGIIALLRHRHPNVLLIGTDGAVESVVNQIHPWLLTTLQAAQCGGHECTATSFPTLVIRHVHELRRGQQEQLVALLDRAADEIQIVSTSRAPLYPAVCGGTFMQTLYYRLNTVVLDMEPTKWHFTV